MSRAAAIALAVATLSGCGGSLSGRDGGAGSGGTSGSGGASPYDAAVPPDLQSQLEAAKVTWALAKSSCNPYSYDRRRSSVFGFAASTEVQIVNDVATRRRYSTFDSLDGGAWAAVWDETGNQVGSHPSSQYAAFPPSTVEQLLAECETVLARDPAAFYLMLQIDSHGVPIVCTNFPHDCFDDCEVGIRISTFTCAPLSGSGPN